MQGFLPLSLSLLLSLQFKTGSGSGVASIFLSRYKNPGGLGDNGNCCDGIRYICRGSCDHYFIICLDQPSGSATNVRQCSIGRSTTGTIDNRNDIRFSNSIGGKPNPILLPFDKWQGGALLKVEVWDHDNNNNDFVELLSTVVTMQASRSQAESQEEVFQAKKRTTLDFYMAVYCDEDWYGTGCDVFCQTSSTDHFNCGTTGQKICHPGWTGEDCTENIDECQSGPCASPGGHCVDEINGFSCVCQPGYTGLVCETDIDECASSPCLNNATCRDLVGKFQCKCPLGFEGDLCQTEISYCASDPCGEGGTCQEAVGNFRCLCPVNATGNRCEIVLDSCGDHFCHNNGTCHEDEKETAVCRCLDGWEGPDCIDNIDDCEGITCPVNMTCADLVGGYECVCEGEDCQVVYTCQPDTCSNGGSCVDGEMGYACICEDGFVGKHCQVRVENVTCSEHPCLNNGTCVALNGTASCHCPRQYLGKLCEKFDPSIPLDPCTSSPCYGKATCSPTSHGWKCACPEDLVGLTCDTPTANATDKVMADDSIASGYIAFYGLASERDVQDIRRHLNSIVGSEVMVYAKVEYCTSKLNGDTLGLLIYKVAKDGKPVDSSVLKTLETEVKNTKLKTSLRITSEDSCDDSAEESEHTVGAWLGQNWWVMLIVVLVLTALCAVLLLIYRRQRSATAKGPLRISYSVKDEMPY